MSTTFKSYLKLTESKFDVNWSAKVDGEKMSGTVQVKAVNKEDAEKEAKKKLSKDKETKKLDLDNVKLKATEVKESVAISQGNFHQLAGLESDHLKKTKDFEMIKAADPEYAEKLLTAWEGDAREYQRNGELKDSLFLRMIDPKNIERLSKIKHNSAVERNLERTAMLFKASMPSKKVDAYKVDTSVWKDVPQRRAYESLQAQVDKLLTERKK